MYLAHEFGEQPLGYAGVSMPGLQCLPVGVERYPVKGGGVIGLSVFPDDQILLIDLEGLQPIELALVAMDAAAAPALHSSDPALSPKYAKAMDDLCLPALCASTIQGQVAAGVTGGGIIDIFKQAHVKKAGSIKGWRLYDPDQAKPGTRRLMSVSGKGYLLVGAPGLDANHPMRPEDQNPPTDIAVYIKRAQPFLTEKGRLPPPPPLADPLLDQTIEPGDAFAYVVEPGQYIQVLDVQGRECSDFQAFDRLALDKGNEWAISSTATHSMNGQLYPDPGGARATKYWSVNGPLVEVVQDTCGRHDTFGLACNARTYEEAGYPGHLNCSDNITRSLAPHGIPARKSWPAVNLFFNTCLDAGLAIQHDDPWTRPGDYVLMRALRPLVCVSTACPSDIDATNGWDPSEVQIRVYKDNLGARSFLGWRKQTEGMMEETRQSGFYPCFAKYTRDFSPVNGYWLANEMTGAGATSEYWACRNKAAVMDLSSLRKYEITGPDAQVLVQRALTRDIAKLSIGQVVYSSVCYDHGGMIDDGTLFRLGENNFRWVGGSDQSGLWLKEQAEGLGAWVRESTEHLCNLAIQGPLSREILSKIIWTRPDQPTMDELGWFRFSIVRLGGEDGPGAVVSRTGFTGELGYEVFCHPKDAPAFFDAIMEVGTPLGLQPIGMKALDTLRIEAGLVIAGNEFCSETDPFEAGIGFTVPLKTQQADFIGRSALETRKAHPRRKAVGLVLSGGTIPATGAPLMVGRARVGEVTSATRSPWLEQVIALARVDVTYSTPGSDIEIGCLDGEQKRLQAKITTVPHFDPTKSRVKGEPLPEWSGTS